MSHEPWALSNGHRPMLISSWLMTGSKPFPKSEIKNRKSPGLHPSRLPVRPGNWAVGGLFRVVGSLCRQHCSILSSAIRQPFSGGLSDVLPPPAAEIPEGDHRLRSPEKAGNGPWRAGGVPEGPEMKSPAHFLLPLLFLALAGCGGGSSGNDGNQVPPAPPALFVQPSPEAFILSPQGQARLLSSVEGSSNQAVTWSASAGQVAPDGLFTAPSGTGSLTISATSVASPCP